jgi:hypothetical protein
VKGHCRRTGIKCEIRPVKYLVLSGNIRCSGYFDDENKKLVVAGNHKDWLAILVHEYAHLTQWVDNCEPWKKGSTGLNNLEHWLSGNKIRSVKDAVNRARNLEHDNEIRSVNLIKKWKLPINLTEYIQKANAYLQFYNYMRYSRKWSKPNNSPYSNPKVWKQMPAKFNMKYETMGKKWFELYKQNNI